LFTYTFDGGTHRLYLNATEVATSALAPQWSTPNTFFIGGYAGLETFAGRIDEVRVYPRAYSPSEVRSLHSSATSSPPSSSSGLVAHWKLDEGTGTFAADSSGLANHGALTNRPAWSPGVAGSSLDLRGDERWVAVRDSGSLRLEDEVTISAWVHLCSYPPTFHDTIVGKAYGYSMAIDSSGRLLSYLNGLRSSVRNSDVIVPTNAWTHLAITFDGAQRRFYINGNLVRAIAETGSFASGVGELRIGSWVVGEVIEGWLDDIRLYNRALSDSEISALFSELAVPAQR
jgi:hypothetical protein